MYYDYNKIDGYLNTIRIDIEGDMVDRILNPREEDYYVHEDEILIEPNRDDQIVNEFVNDIINKPIIKSAKQDITNNDYRIYFNYFSDNMNACINELYEEVDDVEKTIKIYVGNLFPDFYETHELYTANIVRYIPDFKLGDIIGNNILIRSCLGVWQRRDHSILDDDDPYIELQDLNTSTVYIVRAHNMQMKYIMELYDKNSNTFIDRTSSGSVTVINDYQCINDEY